MPRRSSRPDPDTCTRCERSKPLEDFRRRNGSYGVWCKACRPKGRTGGNPAIVGERFADVEDLLHRKYAPLLIRLREQRDKHGRNLPDAARLQLTLVEELVKDLEDTLDIRANLQMHPSRN